VVHGANTSVRHSQPDYITASREVQHAVADQQEPGRLHLVETAAPGHIEQSSFVDDTEMAEILSRPELIKRLKAGSYNLGGISCGWLVSVRTTWRHHPN
jgi:hypothetical protein